MICPKCKSAKVFTAADIKVSGSGYMTAGVSSRRRSAPKKHRCLDCGYMFDDNKFDNMWTPSFKK